MAISAVILLRLTEPHDLQGMPTTIGTSDARLQASRHINTDSNEKANRINTI